jgi:hypothetical protein
MRWGTHDLQETLWGTPRRGAHSDGSGDVLDKARRFFTPDVTRRIASHRRLTRSSMNRAIDSTLPLLLTALADLAAQPQGARKLSRSLARQYPATLATVRNGIGCESQDVAAIYGAGYIEHLIGAEAFAGVRENIVRSAGLRTEEAKLLVGLVGWILMSQLRMEQRQFALNPTGLSYLLHCSRSGPARPMPARFDA